MLSAQEIKHNVSKSDPLPSSGKKLGRHMHYLACQMELISKSGHIRSGVMLDIRQVVLKILCYNVFCMYACIALSFRGYA